MGAESVQAGSQRGPKRQLSLGPRTVGGAFYARAISVLATESADGPDGIAGDVRSSAWCHDGLEDTLALHQRSIVVPSVTCPPSRDICCCRPGSSVSATGSQVEMCIELSPLIALSTLGQEAE